MIVASIQGHQEVEWSSVCVIYFKKIVKLDGVSLVDSRTLHQNFIHTKKLKKNMTLYMWHVTCDTGLVTCDTWYETSGGVLHTHGHGVVTHVASALASLPAAGRHAIKRQFVAGIREGNISYGDVQCMGQTGTTIAAQQLSLENYHNMLVNKCLNIMSSCMIPA